MDQRMSPPKRNSYFQTALADPSKKIFALTRPSYVSGRPSRPTLPPPTGTLKVTVGGDQSQRTWYLPKASLAKHSTYFAKLCNNPYRKDVTLEDLEPRAFANFVDFFHSSIYSLNEHVPNFRSISSNATASLLGTRLGARYYSNAAIRQLYASVEPLARKKSSNAKQSLIRASDIQFVCQVDTPDKLKKLFFDAMASHWTQHEVLNIVNEMDYAGDAVTWAQVYNEYAEFREMVQATLRIVDMSRSALLRPVGEYLTPRSMSVDSAVVFVGRQGRPVLPPRSEISSLRTMGPERRRSKREDGREVGYLDVEAVRTWAVGVTPVANEGDERAVNDSDEDWNVLDGPI